MYVFNYLTLVLQIAKNKQTICYKKLIHTNKSYGNDSKLFIQ